VKRSRVIVPLVAGLVAALMAGCGSSSQPTITAAATPKPTTARPATSSPTTTPAPITTNTVYGTVQDAQGNHAVISIGVGSPTPLEKLSDPGATACNSTITSTGLSLASAVAIPMHVTATVTSSLKTPLGIDLDETGSGVEFLERKQQQLEPLTNYTNLVEVWATSYNTRPACPENDRGAQVSWTAEEITPNISKTWNTWLIIANAVTPNDPSGRRVTNSLLITPRATIAGGSPMNLVPRGSGWIHCPHEESPGLVAVNPHIRLPESVCQRSSI
jgi:hypothetical protein